MDKLTVVSGVPATLHVGAGRLMLYVREHAAELQLPVEFVWAGNKAPAAAAFRRRDIPGFCLELTRHFWRRMQLRLRTRELTEASHLLLFHFQEIGSAWCESLLAKRKKPVWIFVLDSSFFCIRSYNYIPGESQECLRCLGGDFQQAMAHACKPFPIPDTNALPFLKFLRNQTEGAKIGFFAQNKMQGDLLRSHFGPTAPVEVVGLWTRDFPSEAEETEAISGETYDVVYHAEPKDAKGWRWTLEVAKHCPDLRFLFPCSAPEHEEAPANCIFRKMTWETGLKDAVINSRLALAPSLWSAPIEGALVKSIRYAPRTGVAAIDTAFSSEIGEGIVHHLGKNPEAAAETLRQILALPPPSATERNHWWKMFSQNVGFFSRVYSTITNSR